jgi:hypothetical protein
VNWKIIVLHALLLLAVGIASGIFEPQPSSTNPSTFLLYYLLTQCALHLVYAAIFAHLAFRVEIHPFAHALLAILLSHEAASVLLASFQAYFQFESPVRPLPLLVFEYTLLVIALVMGTLAGAHARRRKLLQSGAAGRTAANA